MTRSVSNSAAADCGNSCRSQGGSNPFSCKALKMIALDINMINPIIFLDILFIFDLLWFHDFRGLRRTPSTFHVAFPTLLTIPMGGNYA
jgi:hypothetical protein